MARAKTVHTIEYCDKGNDLKIPLKLVSDSDHRGAAPDFEYQINLDEPIHCRLRGKDPEVITKQLFELLNKHFEISWAPFLYVRVTFGETNCNYSGSNTRGREMHVLIDYVLIGSKPDGTFVHDFYDADREVYTGGPHKPRYNHYAQGKPEVTSAPKKRWSSREDIETKSLIEDTPANRAALNAILAAMEKLTYQLSDLLSKDKIQATLANMPATVNIGMQT
ncbi:MAG: hypothetical protein WC869_00695 [Phycisphaerae bacterium]|jgi:hypothetical protein